MLSNLIQGSIIIIGGTQEGVHTYFILFLRGKGSKLPLFLSDFYFHNFFVR